MRKNIFRKKLVNELIEKLAKIERKYIIRDKTNIRNNDTQMKAKSR